MTRDRQRKLACRAATAAGRMSYTAAHRLHGSAPGTFDQVNGLTALLEFANASKPEADLPTRVRARLASSVKEVCDRLDGLDFDDHRAGDWFDVATAVPDGMEWLRTHEVLVVPVGLKIHRVESGDRVDPDAEAYTAVLEATVSVEGLMDKGRARAAANTGLVRILHPEFNKRYAAVLAPAMTVALGFGALVLPDAESVADLTLLGAMVREPA
jgi:hypothetical protein